MPDYGLLVTPPAQRALDRLPERVAAAIAELVTGDLLTAPRRMGKPLRRELAGIWSARRGSYRVLYEIDEEKQRVVVLRIDHRADIYRP
ncbi:MAG TPA: type II toxin-antitoxin system RelE/ParE family toxin [Streptosporangiaceae bacterium]|nr:type II toxin-antitoxin system RelE/ParE family toxin [Streptosporangiaceae bacterium]